MAGANGATSTARRSVCPALAKSTATLRANARKQSLDRISIASRLPGSAIRGTLNAVEICGAHRERLAGRQANDS